MIDIPQFRTPHSKLWNCLAGPKMHVYVKILFLVTSYIIDLQGLANGVCFQFPVCLQKCFRVSGVTGRFLLPFSEPLSSTL